MIFLQKLDPENLVLEDMLGHVIHAIPPTVTIHAALRTRMNLFVRGGAPRWPNAVQSGASASSAGSLDARRCNKIEGHVYIE